MTEKHIYINGVYRKVIEEILQSNQPIGCLQAYSPYRIKELVRYPPDEKTKWILYGSYTSNLKLIAFTAEIVKWENKQNLSNERKVEVSEFLKAYQPKEVDLFKSDTKNLLTITNLRVLINPVPVSRMIKINNNLPLKERTRSGGWSYVKPLHNWDVVDQKELYDLAFENEVQLARKMNHEKRIIAIDEYESSLAAPEKKESKTTIYKRNPFIIAEILYRANGICQLCKQRAPFYKPDGEPYLEVHHWTPLSEGGLDNLSNTTALCPNCHKEAHFGKDREYIKTHKAKSI